MTFKQWVLNVGGEEKAAAILGINQRSIRAWYFGERSPSAKNARKIYEGTGRKVDYNGIFNNTAAPAKSSRAAG